MRMMIKMWPSFSLMILLVAGIFLTEVDSNPQASYKWLKLLGKEEKVSKSLDSSLNQGTELITNISSLSTPAVGNIDLAIGEEIRSHVDPHHIQSLTL